MTAVSIVIAALNAEHTIAQQLEALASQVTDREWEVIVADNGSKDRTRTVVASFEGRLPLRLIAAAERPGAGYARNRAAEIASGSILLFCDADDAADAGWVHAMADAAERHGFVGGAIDRSRYQPDSTRTPVVRSAGLHRTAAGQSFAIGAAIGVRRRLFQLVGGFDENYVGGNEDADLALRLLDVGVTPTFVPDAVMHYRDRPTRLSTFLQYRKYGMTEAQLYRKHPEHAPRDRLAAGLRYWARIVVTVMQSLRTPTKRILAVRLIGRGVGRLQGSIRYRTLII